MSPAAPNGLFEPPTATTPWRKTACRGCCFSDAGSNAIPSRPPNGHILVAAGGLRHPRLDSETNKLTPAERTRVEKVLRAYLGK